MEANRQESSIGDVIKNSFLLAGKNVGGIIQILVVMYIIQVLIIMGVAALGTYYLSKGVDSISIFVVIGSALIAFLIQSLSTGAVLKLVDERKKGNKFNLLHGFKYMFFKIPQLFGTTILMIIITTITGFIGTILYTFLGYYIQNSGIVFGIFFGAVLAIIDVILLSFIVPLIVKKDMNFIKAFITGVKIAFNNGGSAILKLIAFMLITAVVMGISGFLALIPYAGYFIALIITQIMLIIYEIGQLIVVEEYFSIKN